MTIAVLVNGAFGRMGQITAKTISEDERFQLVGQTGREYDLKQAIIDSKADVVIDFTHPAAVEKNAQIIIEAGARPVIGTSGLTDEAIKKLTAQCAKQKLGGIIAPNFSLGAVLMIKYAAEIVKYIPQVEIIEYHHDRKLDSPSGTAIRTADMIASARAEARQIQPAHETVKGSRGASYKGIPIHAIRMPGFLAHQEIIFGDTGETLTLRHDSIDRVAFMPGVKLACEKVMSLQEMVYGLENLL